MNRLQTLLFALTLIATSAQAVERVDAVALFNNRALLKIDGERRLLRAGETSPEGVRLVSSTSERAVVEFDGQSRELALGGHIGGSFATPEQQSTTLYRDASGMFRTHGTINGRLVNLMLDTGATSIAMNEHEARRLGIDFRVKGEQSLIGTASGTVVGYKIQLNEVRVGPITQRNVTAVVMPGTSPEEVLLGASFLRNVDMEHKGNALELRSRY
ncbi:MAG: TIGR02281 family clan AA aspartic protease [Chromatiales bacterium]|nr:TIGR02281 family clan AA aspartic protease [Chromatiales bacterium]